METNQQNAKIVTHSKKKIAAIAVAVLIITLAAALTSGILITSQNPSSSQTSNQSTSQSWIAIGAYATYAGQATVLSIQFTSTQQWKSSASTKLTFKS